jgi:hypothetical protein
LALARAKQAYHDWQRHTVTDLTDQYRLLSDELEIATIAYRALHRCPDLYSHSEYAFWVHWWLTEEEASRG